LQEVFERYCSAIKKLSRLDHSESQITEDTKHKHGMVNVLDYSESAGGKLRLTIKFANLIDMSEAKIKHLVIQGRANIVDLSKAEIGILDISGLEAVHIDYSESNIGKEIRK